MSYMQVSDYPIEIIRSSRKTVALQMLPDGSLRLKAPRSMKQAEIQRFLDGHKTWIDKHRKMAQERRQAAADVPKLTVEEIQALAREACRVIPERVRYYAPLIGVSYGRITIRNQRTRWGSCTTRGNLNFNCLLLLTPPEVLDSVVVHELCHRREMNHSRAFYEQVLRVFPEYRKWDKWLKENGAAIMARMASG